jgi:transcriptional regulator with XRE-family HTH domain
MHVELAIAVCELRRLLQWSQTELARAIDKHSGKTSRTDYMTISRWERGIDSPSPAKRMALAKISTKRGHEDLAKRFRAPVVAWHLVATLRTHPVKGS